MATYALIHGGAHGGSCWYLLAAELEGRGHRVVAPDLPIDEAATLTDHAQVVIDAVGDTDDVVVVAHSLGGLVGPIVADLVDADLLVLLAAMVPKPGETCLELWEATGFAPRLEADEAVDADDSGDDQVIMSQAAAIAAFYHDVPSDWRLEPCPSFEASPPRCSANHGRWPPGPMWPRATSCVATTAWSRPSGPARLPGTAWGWCPTRSTAATRRSCPGRSSWPTCSNGCACRSDPGQTFRPWR